MTHDSKILILHGFGSNCSKPRYQNLPLPTLTVDVNHTVQSWDEIFAIYNGILTREFESGNKILLFGHSLGGWWARFFAKTYDLIAVLANPALEPYNLDLDINRKEVYRSHTFPFAREKGTLHYYIELGDQNLEFSKDLPAIKSEGSLVTIEGGHHKIQYNDKLREVVGQACSSLLG